MARVLSGPLAHRFVSHHSDISEEVIRVEKSVTLQLTPGQKKLFHEGDHGFNVTKEFEISCLDHLDRVVGPEKVINASVTKLETVITCHGSFNTDSEGCFDIGLCCDDSVIGSEFYRAYCKAHSMPFDHEVARDAHPSYCIRVRPGIKTNVIVLDRAVGPLKKVLESNLRSHLADPYIECHEARREVRDVISKKKHPTDRVTINFSGKKDDAKQYYHFPLENMPRWTSYLNEHRNRFPHHSVLTCKPEAANVFAVVGHEERVDPTQHCSYIPVDIKDRLLSDYKKEPDGMRVFKGAFTMNASEFQSADSMVSVRAIVSFVFVSVDKRQATNELAERVDAEAFGEEAEEALDPLENEEEEEEEEEEEAGEPAREVIQLHE